MIPNLNAEIIPVVSAAGIELGLNFDDFIAKSNYRIVKDYKELENIGYEKNKWLILYRNEVLSWDNNPINEIYCFWNKAVILTFTKKLEFIYVSEGYTGKLLGLLKIGDRLDSVKDQYNFSFEGDKHYLEYRDGRDQTGETIPVEIETNYRIAYSEEYSEQFIEGFLVYLLPEDRGH